MSPVARRKLANDIGQSFSLLGRGRLVFFAHCEAIATEETRQICWEQQLFTSDVLFDFKESTLYV